MFNTVSARYIEKLSTNISVFLSALRYYYSYLHIRTDGQKELSCPEIQLTNK